MSKILTNLSLIDVDDVDIEVGLLAPYDPEVHQRLEHQHFQTHVFRRHEDRLEVVQIEQEAQRIGDNFENRSVRRLGALLCALIEESLLRSLETTDQNRRYSVRRRHPIVFCSLDEQHDVVHQLFLDHSKRRVPFSVSRGFEVEARRVSLVTGRRVALAIDACTCARVDITCDRLIADGFNVVGLYVKEATGTNGRRSNKERFQTVGIVSGVEGDSLVLGHDRRDSRSRIPADQAFLDPSPAAMNRLTDYYIGVDAHERLWEEKAQLSAGRARWQRINGLREWLAKKPKSLAPGIFWRASGWLDSTALRVAPVPLPRFQLGGGRHDNSTSAVFRCGPSYTPIAVTQRVDACLICEESRRREVERFISELRDGFRAHKGMQKTWRIGELQWQTFPAAASTAAAYEKACRAALDASGAWRIALVQVPETSHDLSGDDNPYLVAKAKFLSRGIPVQEFTDETLQKPVTQRPWVLGGIGLQVFAKLGGIPWLLEAPDQSVQELVLGLGSAQLGTGRFGNRERLVGLATAFSGDGTYWLSETSRVTPYEEHEEALGETILAAVKRVRANVAWQSNRPVRLVFHSFKPFRGSYVNQIHQLLSGLKGDGFSVQCAFVHIAERHPNLIFDSAHDQRIATRGTAVWLSDYDALVSVVGPDEVRRDGLGFPSPLCLHVHRDSTFKDMRYIARQVVAFSAHSWRNFTPTSLPVTLLYAELIAKMLGRLGNLSKWDPDVLRGDVGSRWFL